MSKDFNLLRNTSGKKSLMLKLSWIYTLSEVSEENQEVVVAAGCKPALANFLVHLKAESQCHYFQGSYHLHLQSF